MTLIFIKFHGTSRWKKIKNKNYKYNREKSMKQTADLLRLIKLLNLLSERIKHRRLNYQYEE